MRLAARAAFSTQPDPGVSPFPGRGRSGWILDYYSRDMVPPFGGASRNRETIRGLEMGLFARNVKPFRRNRPNLTHLPLVRGLVREAPALAIRRAPP